LNRDCSIIIIVMKNKKELSTSNQSKFCFLVRKLAEYGHNQNLYVSEAFSITYSKRSYVKFCCHMKMGGIYPLTRVLRLPEI
jgi:hypothetical protein